uniref:Uncharacterized protein n=1 Tax=Parascaris equorum TaxID=6256 RepID=A0A914R7E2_PAREQ
MFSCRTQSRRKYRPFDDVLRYLKTSNANCRIFKDSVFEDPSLTFVQVLST